MSTVHRKVKLITEQHTIEKESPVSEYPMKAWTVKIYLLDQDGSVHPADVFTKATYNLHPSFPNPIQTFTEPPFACVEEGWGEFEMSIDLFHGEKGCKNTIFHDLNFKSERYENTQPVSFKNPTPELLAQLRETGPVPAPGDEAAKARKANEGKRRKSPYDIEKIADGLNKLDEDALLHVVQLIHDNKTEGIYTKNDIDNGEFSVDLYTLPETLLKAIWDHLEIQNAV